MHKLLSTLICLFILSSTYGQNDCSYYYPFTQGTVTELTAFDKKGKKTSTTEYIVKEVGSNNVTVSSKISDKDGSVIAESDFEMSCSGSGINIDIKSMYSPQLAMQYENMETTITGSDIALPNSLSVGDELPDAEMFVSINMSGININVDVMMLDRKVIGEESITTPAGDFDCVIIEYNSKIKMGLERNTSAKQWFAKGIGLVKQEEYNKRGKLTGSTVLTNFE